jgi:flotillin
LGLARTAEVQRDARIGEADANMTTVIKEAIASEELMKSKLINDTEIARYLIVHILESLYLSIGEAA